MDLSVPYALFFPGQGSQAIGMGKALAENFESARRVYEEADEALGLSISKLCFEGPEDQLALTANTQPAILTTSIAAFRVASELADLNPVAALGHSLGEFSALVAVGALNFADAVRLVRLRGEAMQAAVPAGVGAMAAIIGMELEELETLCAKASDAQEQVAPANENGGSQVVVAGHTGAVARLCDLAEAADGRAIPLKVSAPFHCTLMAPAAKRLAEALEPIVIGDFSTPVIANVDAEPNDDPGRVKGLLVEQVTSRVKWESSVRKALHMGVQSGMEMGHGKVIRGLVRRIERSLKVAPFGSPADFDVLSA